jgi:hypothetical protein
MKEEFFRDVEHMFAIKGAIDENQHWHGDSYPWASGTNPRIERQIGDTSSSTE